MPETYFCDVKGILEYFRYEQVWFLQQIEISGTFLLSFGGIGMFGTLGEGGYFF